MAFNFPDSPNVNDEYTAGDRTWVWDGTVWLDKGSTLSFSELTDSEHASTHESGGSDEIEIAQSQVTGLDTGTAGQVVLSDGTSGVKFETGYVFRETVYFTSSGTFSKGDYPWLKAIRVKCQGGGGGSGGNQDTSGTGEAAGAGGGGGAYAESFLTDISGLASSVSITVGLGGSKGLGGTSSTMGSDGGTSSFGSIVSAEGGSRGNGGFQSLSGQTRIRESAAGGVTATGDLTIGGGAGQGAVAESGRWYPLGGGGSSVLAGAAPSAVSPFGNLYGGGAGGRISYPNTTNGDGGDGGDGIVILELFA